MELSNTPIRYLVVIAMVTMFAALAHADTNQEWEEHDATLVGRISHLEGTLSRYDIDQEQWLDTHRDAPVVSDDRLQSAADAKAEVILPSNIWIRMDGDTEIQLVSIDNNATEMDIPFGTARLYNKNSVAQIKTTTPFGHIITPAGAGVDIYVYDDGVEIIAFKNQVHFVHISSDRQYEVQVGSGSIFADTRQVSSHRGDGSLGWSKWNKEMDALWAMRAQTKGESTTYLPPALHHDAYALDTHGRWERVYYEGRHYRFWRPVHVHANWTPFSSGVWRVRWGDHVWIPHEPFGYVTHHYGNWVYTSSHWYWAPPVTRVMIRAGLPLFHIGFSWYPGRVAWIHTSAHIGWFPLAPFEPYYSHRHWGRRSIVVNRGGHVRHKRHTYRHRRHATVIHRTHLYRDRNYRSARVRNISRTTIEKNFRTSPVLNKTTVRNDRVRRYKKSLDGDRQKLRQRQPIQKDKRRSDRWTTGKPTPNQRHENHTKNTQRRSGVKKDHTKRTPQLKRPSSPTPGEQIQRPQQRKVRSKDQRRDRNRTTTVKRGRQSGTAKTQFRRKTVQKSIRQEVSKPKKIRRQPVTQQYKDKRGVKISSEKDRTQKVHRRSKALPQNAQPKQRHTQRVERGHSPRKERQHRVQKRPTQRQSLGRAYQTKRSPQQKMEASRGSSPRSVGRRSSQSGRRSN